MSSEWTGPAPVAQEYPANEPNGTKRLVDLVLGLKRDLRESTSNLLGTAGIFVTKLGMRIASSLTVEGSLDVTGNLAASGTTTLGGDVAITGTLSLPAGIIDNDALANPVIFDGTFVNEFNFALSTTPTQRATCTFVVPAGFTKMAFTMMGDLYAINSTASTQYVYVQSFRLMPGGAVNNGADSQATLPAGFRGTVLAPYIYQDDVAPGDTITFYTKVWASAAMAVDASHRTSSIVAITLTR